ncbi:MAG: hypothetical protein ABGY95_12900 [Rubritalea sp.]|uniref:hypothetical protein n=1 Tax=Rubritalea sp. TaxID=2109375 RepID=UPI00324216F1
MDDYLKARGASNYLNSTFSLTSIGGVKITCGSEFLADPLMSCKFKTVIIAEGHHSISLSLLDDCPGCGGTGLIL